MKLVKLLMLMLLLLLASGGVYAQEHLGCKDFEYRYEAHSSEELREIAASCKSKSIANLYYNRAYHVDLVLEASVFNGLVVYSGDSSRVRIDSYRLYIALLEQMAPIWFPDISARVAFLNHEYDRRGEIARLRLRGYDRVADQLERTSLTR
jgi:hypothetical protein